ncbi:MAG TPA: HAD family acid phosphatase [Candidatus Nanopelagicales bacterium]|nr:HAD family acid phosphatase [Candidatus Nanopelagicales bacterium]
MTETPRGIVVFDIDGVLADVRHRLHHVEGRRKDWPAFFASMDDDEPLPDGVDLARRYAEDGYRIAYLTGRNEAYRRLTTAWLERQGLPDGRLVMRREDDRRPARVFKPQAVSRLARDGDIVEVVDDDLAVVRVLRDEGWTVRHADWMRPDEEEQESLFDAQEIEGRT